MEAMKNKFLILSLLAFSPLVSCAGQSSSSASGTTDDYTIVKGEESPLKAEFSDSFVLDYDNDTNFTGEGIAVTFDGEPLSLSECFFTIDSEMPKQYEIETGVPFDLSQRDADVTLYVAYIPDGSTDLYLSNGQEIHVHNEKVLSYWVYIVFVVCVAFVFAGFSAFKAYMRKKGVDPSQKKKKVEKSPVPMAEMDRKAEDLEKKDKADDGEGK